MAEKQLTLDVLKVKFRNFNPFKVTLRFREIGLTQIKEITGPRIQRLSKT